MIFWVVRCVLLLLSFASTTLFAASQQIAQQLAQLEASYPGLKIGISAIDTSNDHSMQYRANQRFPMGCTSKVMGVAAILKKSMTDDQLLQKRIFYSQKDILVWAPITKQHLSDGMTIKELSAAAISYSDNTAMNLLTEQLGGPAGINSFARSIGDNAFQLDHGWPDEANGNLFNGTDSSTPAAMQNSLQIIALGNVLAPKQRKLLQTWMIENTTGNARIRAGVPKGWVVADKTGTGFYYGTANDIGLIWAPHCSPIVLAVFTTSTEKDAPKRDAVIASATQLIINGFAQTNACIKNALAQSSSS
jgi:beta-lactamase class A